MIEDESGPKVITEPRTDTGTEGMAKTTTGLPLKRPQLTEWSKSQKKTKASKLDRELVTLTEGDLGEIEDTVCEVTQEVFNEAMIEQQTMLGALYTQLQELEVQPSQSRIITTHGTTSMSATELLL